MKGFKKNGKFIPTGKRNKSSLKKDDVLIDKFGRRSDDSKITKTTWQSKDGKTTYVKFDYFGKGDPKYDERVRKGYKPKSLLQKLKIRKKESVDDDYKLFDESYTIKSKVPTHVAMSSPDSKLPPVSVIEGGSESVRDYWNNKNLRKRKDESIEDFHKRCKKSFDDDEKELDRKYEEQFGDEGQQKEWDDDLKSQEEHDKAFKKFFAKNKIKKKTNHLPNDPIPENEKDKLR